MAATPSTPDPALSIQIREQDLKGDCGRLNRVLGLLARQAGKGGAGTTIENVTNITGSGGTPSGNVRVAY